MAEILEIKETNEPVIAKVSEIAKAAEDLKKRTELPKKPGDRVRSRELHDWLQLLTPDMEQQIVIYVYRLDPPIIRQKISPDLQNNIDIISDGFKTLDPEQYLIDRQGGGKYQLVVKNQGYKPKARGDNNGYFECIVDVPYSVHPVKLAHIHGTGLNLLEVNWEDPKANNFKEWAKAQGLIDKDCKMIENKPNGAPTVVAGGMDPATLKLMLDFASKMSDKEQESLKRKIGGEDATSKSLNELFLAKLNQEDPNKQMTSMASILGAIKGMMPEPKADNTMSTILPLIIKMMDDSRAAADRNMNMMMELFKANSSRPAEKEEGSKLEELKALIDIAREIKGGGHAAEKTTTESLIELGTSVLPGVINLIGNITAMNAAAKGIQVPNKPVVEQPQGATNFRTLHEQNTMNSPQPVPQQQQQVNGAPQLTTNEAANMIQQFGPIIINKLAGEGWEFAAWVSEGFGDAAAASLAKYGPDALLVAAKSVPEFWQRVEATYGEAHMKKWLASLCNYKEIIKQMEAEENGEDEVEEKVQ